MEDKLYIKTNNPGESYKMKEYLGKKVLWVAHPNAGRLWEHQIRCSTVTQLSPSGKYVMMGNEQWYHTAYIQILEVLGESSKDVI